MKALLLKDFYTLGKQMKFFVIFILIFSCVPKMAPTAFAIVYSSMLPVTVLAYDERSKWTNLALMMPYSIKSMVVTKYLIGYIGMVLTTIISIIAKFIYFNVNGLSGFDEMILTTILSLCVGCIMLAILMPLLFRFGVEKGRLFLLVIFGCVMGGTIAISKIMPEINFSFALTMTQITLIVVAFTVIATIVSIILSGKLYQKKIMNWIVEE